MTPGRSGASASFAGFAWAERPQKAFDAEVDRDPVGLVPRVDAVAPQKGVKGAGAKIDWRCVPDGDRADEPDAVRSTGGAHRWPQDEVAAPAADRFRERPFRRFKRAAR